MSQETKLQQGEDQTDCTKNYINWKAISRNHSLDIPNKIEALQQSEVVKSWVNK